MMTMRLTSDSVHDKTDSTPSGWLGNDAGYTLIELMIASTISLGIIGGGFAYYLSMQGVLVKEDKSNVTQRNARIAMSAVVNIVRKAGSDPADIVNFQAFATTPTPTRMQVYADSDGDGNISNIIGTNEDVIISFAGNPKYELTLTRPNSSTATFYNIADATFTYLDSSLATTTTWSDIKVVEVAITGTKGNCSPAVLTAGQVANCNSATEMVSQVRPWNLNLL